MNKVRRMCCVAAVLTGCGDDARDGGDEAGARPTDGGGDGGLEEAGAGSGVDGGAGRLDVGGGGEGGGPGDCGRGGSDVEFTNIWIANSDDNPGTVSKIDTRTGEEVGRFVAAPMDLSQPSRTSVNLRGDVVVASRGHLASGSTPSPGGVTKIAAREEDCVDRNGNGTIETSTNATALPWDADECVLWHHPIPSFDFQRGPRPVAWEGKLGGDGCAATDADLWVGWYEFGGGTSRNIGHFRKLKGDTGETLAEVSVPSWGIGEWGPYGGAVDGDGDFWVIGFERGPLIRIDGDTHEATRWDFPTPPDEPQPKAYGIALDPDGEPWVATLGSLAHFDPQGESWSFVKTQNASMRGLMIDREGRAFVAVSPSNRPGGPYPCGVSVIDTATESVIADLHEFEGCEVPVGVSIDVDGFAWIVDQRANAAFKLDPDTYAIEARVEGLIGPYTYSDMTGAGLDLVTFPPTG